MGIVSPDKLPGSRKKTAGTWFSAPPQKDETPYPVNGTCARKVVKTDGGCLDKHHLCWKNKSVVYSH